MICNLAEDCTGILVTSGYSELGRLFRRGMALTLFQVSFAPLILHFLGLINAHKIMN